MMEFALEGQEIGRVCVDYAVVLETVDGTELRLESRFQISSPDDSAEIDPERLEVTGGTAVTLLRQQVARASVGESGVLSIQFANGQQLRCDPDGQFEAWTLTTASGERMVCLPGGGVAHWPGASP
jgi:hypothetical protein